MTITSVGRRHRGLAAGLARASSRACARRIDGTWTGFVHGYYTDCQQAKPSGPGGDKVPSARSRAANVVSISAS